MPPTVKLGYGSQFKLGDGGGSEVFNLIAEVHTVGPPQMTRDAVDATTHDSLNGFREFIGGLADGGQVQVDAHYLPGNTGQGFSTGLGAVFYAGTVRNFQIVLPNSLGTWSFSGVITAYNPMTPIDGKMGLTVTIKVSGRPSFA